MSMAPPFGVSEDIGVEAFIDGQGNVYDFRITHLPSSYPVTSSETSAKLRAQLANALLATRFGPGDKFRPAQARQSVTLVPAGDARSGPRLAEAVGTSGRKQGLSARQSFQILAALLDRPGKLITH